VQGVMTAEDKMKRAVILMILAILICAAAALYGFLHLWGVV
jgi:hypothetical protein